MKFLNILGITPFEFGKYDKYIRSKLMINVKNDGDATISVPHIEGKGKI